MVRSVASSQLRCGNSIILSCFYFLFATATVGVNGRAIRDEVQLLETKKHLIHREVQLSNALASDGDEVKAMHQPSVDLKAESKVLADNKLKDLGDPEPADGNQERHYLREDLALICILLLLSCSCCYCASDIEVEDVSTEGKVELIRNPLLSGGCKLLAQRPGLSFLITTVTLLSTSILARHYDRLKNERVHLEPFNTRLDEIHKREIKDYPMVEHVLPGTIMIWNDRGMNMENSSALAAVIDQIDLKFHSLKEEEPGCDSLSWKGYRDAMSQDDKSNFMSSGKDAALVKLTLKPKSIGNRKTDTAPGQREECFGSLRGAVSLVNEQTKGLHVSMASSGALVDASLEQCLKEAASYAMISCPLMVFLLMLGVGSPLRAVTPLAVILASMTGMKATMVLIKRSWRDLNFAGPDTVVEFVMLALCFDYALFYWTRFAAERRRRPEESLAKAVYATLQSSGYVIMLSMLVIAVVNLIICFYPNANAMGFVGMSLQFMTGIVFTACYSLLIPTILTLWLPSLFDEAGSHSCLQYCTDFVSRNITVRPWWVKKTGAVITRPPMAFIVPAVVFICMIPCVLTLRTLNFSYGTGYTSKTVPEYTAHEIYAKMFDMNHLHPTPIFLEAVPLDEVETEEQSDDVDESRLYSRVSTGISLAPEFGKLTCQFVETMMRETQGEVYQINPEDVVGLWWNSKAGGCMPMAGLEANGLQGRCVPHGPCLPADGKDQMLLIYKDAASPDVHHMVQRFWDKIEPQANNWTFTVNGQHFRYQATLDVATAEEMLVAKQDARMIPWIWIFSLVCICCLVGSSFGSAFLMVKLVFTVFLPILAEYGLLVGIYQHGWLEFAGVEKVPGIPWPIVFSTGPFLLALAMDYDIFLFARVYELRLEGYENRAAVRIALEETCPAITLAGSLMVLAFFFIWLTSIPIVSMTGCLYCLGVAVDTYIVRTLIAPPVLCMFESLNYWPAKMPQEVKDYESYDRMCQPSNSVEDSPEA